MPAPEHVEGRSWGSALVHLGELHQDAWGTRGSPQLPAHLSCLAGSGGALWGPLSKPKADSTNELQHKLGLFQQLLAPQQGRAAPCPQQVMGGRGQGRAGRGSQPPACPRLCPAGFYTSTALFDGREVEEQEAWAWVWVSRDPPGKLGGLMVGPLVPRVSHQGILVMPYPLSPLLPPSPLFSGAPRWAMDKPRRLYPQNDTSK